ncbi:helix-turn-helix domain-containing protein [Sphingomonas sp. PAMC 26605]|uniref:helix-turn-helix domain-containing protein n=1 Tax=Sphingomonas sp. PAMC 26605 TaxID=1112214 RepID=UPI00026CAC38|nr:helix-turn-helix domain-containing protein [Sphingomonas sp. PAMC 26605]
MTAVITPGAYLKRCRQAAGLSVADVAARLPTDPPSPEHLRGEWLELIEADATPASFRTIIALRTRGFRFDIHVLSLLEAIAQGIEATPPRLCRICACSDHAPCMSEMGDGCTWVAEDLCSACGDAPVGQHA